MKAPTFDLSTFGNADTPAKARKMTAAQAEKCDAIRYRVFSRGKLLDAFNRGAHWPLIWGDVGCRIQRGGKWFSVRKVSRQLFARLVRVYVAPCAAPKAAN